MTPPTANGDVPTPASSAALVNGTAIERLDTQPESAADQAEINEQPSPRSDSPDTPDKLEPFDWKDFEARYQAALVEANEEERAVLREAESLSKFFQSWASAASTHDDRRAVKRLQTRERFVHLSEEKLAQKQQHYVEVVRAFETALALLKTTS